MTSRCRLVSVIVTVLLGLALAACSAGSSASGQATSVDTPAPVVKDRLDVVSAEAVVVPVRKADLSFQTVGRVSQVLISEGDQVKAGQDLARLEESDLEQAVLQAEAEVKSAQAQLAKVEAGARPEEVASAQAAVAIAQAGVKAREIAVKVAEGNLASAQSTLASAQAGVKIAELAVQVARGNVLSAQATQASAQANLAKLLAGPTKRDLEIAEKQVELAQNSLWGLQGQRDALGGQKDMGRGAEYEAAKGEVAAAESRVAIAQLQLEELRAGARPEDVAASRAQVDQAKAGVQTAQGQLDQVAAEVESAKAKVTQAEAGVKIAEAQVEQAKVDVETAKAQVEQAQAQLNLVKAGSRAEDVAVAQAAVARASAALAAAQSNLNEAVLQAPFDGTVGDIPVNSGELVSSAIPAVRMGDLTKLRVETEDLSEVDVSQVREGQKAQVTVDALEGQVFQGTVVRVAPIATDWRGDKVYKVTLDLDAGPDSGLRWGMSAFVEIQVR